MQVGLLLATHGAAVVAAHLNAARAMNLKRALQTGRDIGVAIGVLMTQHQVTRDQAFGLLRITSPQTTGSCTTSRWRSAPPASCRCSRHPWPFTPLLVVSGEGSRWSTPPGGFRRAPARAQVVQDTPRIGSDMRPGQATSPSQAGRPAQVEAQAVDGDPVGIVYVVELVRVDPARGDRPGWRARGGVLGAGGGVLFARTLELAQLLDDIDREVTALAAPIRRVDYLLDGQLTTRAELRTLAGR
jgi:hypothetical protein